jgi:hypothetical protein
MTVNPMAAQEQEFDQAPIPEVPEDDEESEEDEEAEEGRAAAGAD